MAEEGEGRGEGSRGGGESGGDYSGSKSSESKKTFLDLSDPAKGIFEQQDKVNYPEQFQSSVPQNIQKYIEITAEQAMTYSDTWNAQYGTSIWIRVSKYVTAGVVSIFGWDLVSVIADTTGDNLAGTAIYGNSSSGVGSLGQGTSEYDYIVYPNSSLPWYPQHRSIQVTWTSGYTKTFNVLIPGRMSIHPYTPGFNLNNLSRVHDCSPTGGVNSPYKFLALYRPKTSVSTVFWKFAYWATIAGPQDTFFQGAWSINTSVGVFPGYFGTPSYGADLSWISEQASQLLSAPATSQNLVNGGSPVPGVPGEQHAIGIIATNIDTYFTGTASAYQLPSISQIPQPGKYYNAVSDAMGGEHLFGYNGMGNGAQWRSIQVYAYNLPPCGPVDPNRDILEVCLDPNTVAYYQYTGVECAGTTITAANMQNPSLVNWIDGGCCPECDITLTATAVSPTTNGGTDGNITLSIVDSTGTATGTANYTYVIAPVNNEDAGQGNGVNIGSGAVSSTSFTFGTATFLLQTLALGNPTYATSSLTGYVPAVTSSGGSSTGLEAGNYNVYVFDSTVNPATVGGTPDPDGCLARTMVTLINPPIIAGCTDNNAGTNDGVGLNYNTNAIVDDGSCLYCKAATGELVDNNSNPFSGGTAGPGEIIEGQTISVDPALNSTDTTSAVINFSAWVTPTFQNFINDVLDATGIQNAEYEMQLYKLSGSTQTLTGASTVGGQVTNTVAQGFNFAFNTANLPSGGTLSSMTYGHYAIKVWVDDPDSSSEIEQCYQVIWVDIPVFVCDIDLLTSDGVYISNPALQSLTNIICNVRGGDCCGDPILSLIPDINGALCNAHFQLDVICIPSPQTVEYQLQLYDSATGWNTVLTTVPFAQSNTQTVFIHQFSNTTLNMYGAGDYRVLVTSTYLHTVDCHKVSNVLEWIPPIYGCMDTSALNYNQNATCPDICIWCIYGCMNPLSSNYNINATCDDGSCIIDVYGCTDPSAINYNPLATIDDGSCIWQPCGCTDTMAINFGLNCAGDPAGNPPPCDDGCCITCIGNEPVISTITSTNATVTAGTCDCNADGSITLTVVVPTGVTWTVTYRTWGGINSSGSIYYTDPTVYSSGSSATYNLFLCGNYEVVVTDANNCVTTIQTVVGSSSATCGCMDPNASNYNSSATVDDGTCIYCGCTDSNAINYNPNATCDDGTCIYQIVPNPCIPTNIDRLILTAQLCIALNGFNFYSKYITGQSEDCSIMNVWKLILIEYLLSKKGLNCIYNCADVGTISADVATLTCSDIWVTGGPSTGLNDAAVTGTGVGTTSTATMFTSGTLYSGDVIKHHTSGNIWILNGSAVAGTLSTVNVGGYDPESFSGAQSNYWIQCNDSMRVTNFTDSTNYLDIFSKFITKFCSNCDIPTGNPMLGTTLYNSRRGGRAEGIDDIEINNQNLNI